jgi:hypothetical protein
VIGSSPLAGSSSPLAGGIVFWALAPFMVIGVIGTTAVLVGRWALGNK